MLGVVRLVNPKSKKRVCFYAGDRVLCDEKGVNVVSYTLIMSINYSSLVVLSN